MLMYWKCMKGRQLKQSNSITLVDLCKRHLHLHVHRLALGKVPFWRWLLGNGRRNYTTFVTPVGCHNHWATRTPGELQSWTKVMTHLSKTNTFYPRPCVNSNNIFFTYSLTPSPPFQCWKTLRWHWHVITTLKRGEGVEKWKFEIEKLTRLTKQVFFEECLNYFLSGLSGWASSLNWLEHPTSVMKVMGSIPTWNSELCSSFTRCPATT